MKIRNKINEINGYKSISQVKLEQLYRYALNILHFDTDIFF